MTAGYHRAPREFAAVDQPHALDPTASRDDLSNRCADQYLATELFKPCLHGVAQLLHPPHNPTNAEAMKEAQQRVIDAAAIGAYIAREPGQRAHRRYRHGMLEAFTGGLMSRAGHQRHQLGFELAVLQRRAYDL